MSRLEGVLALAIFWLAFAGLFVAGILVGLGLPDEESL